MPSSSTRVAALLGDLSAALEEVHARWYLFGAQASILHGATRLTADVDVTVDLTGIKRSDLLDALGRRGFDAELDDPKFIEVTRVIPLVHRRTHMPVDLVLAGPGLEDLFFKRARRTKIGRKWIVVAAPEDIISMKILSGRPKDIEDVEALLVARRDDLDLAIIHETLSVAETMLDQSDLVPVLEDLLRRLPTRSRRRRTAKKGTRRRRRAKP